MAPTARHAHCATGYCYIYHAHVFQLSQGMAGPQICPIQQVLNPTPLNHTPATFHKRKTEVALQLPESCAAETALQHSLLCCADVVFTKSCAATNEKLYCNIENAALQQSGAFLPLSCGFQAPTFGCPRLGLADLWWQRISQLKLPSGGYRAIRRNR